MQGIGLLHIDHKDNVNEDISGCNGYPLSMKLSFNNMNISSIFGSSDHNHCS